MAHERAVRNDEHERSILGSNSDGTETRRVVENSDGSIATANLRGDLSIPRDSNGRITQIDKTVDTTTHRTTFTRDSNGRISSVAFTTV